MTFSRRTRVLGGLVMLLCLGTACSNPAAPTASSLKVVNTGPTDIRGLVVYFPQSTVDFGDVRAGGETALQPVTGGVYSYAAFAFKLDGKLIQQPVIDWTGEKPLEGFKFAYDVALVSGRDGSPIIQIKSVSGVP